MPWSLNGLNSEEIKDQCVKVAAYDRGHLIPANHFDDNKNTITETNYVR
jgi:DNA/RNA endonuclease G (NUC1)